MASSNDTFDRRSETGSFDIIGDVHGCIDELETLLLRLGYGIEWTWSGSRRLPTTSAPAGRRAVFVGDLVDRGPGAADTVSLVMTMCAAGQALCVPGNHDFKFRRWLDGHNVTRAHGLDLTIAEFETWTPQDRVAVSGFLRTLPYYLWLDGGALVVTHAGILPEMIGTISHRIESFCLYGDTDNRRNAGGFPIRYNWATRYDGAALVVYGHTCVDEPAWVNGTVCIDTGCCFGGSLTALRYPERQSVSVPAVRQYAVRDGKFGLPPSRQNHLK